MRFLIISCLLAASGVALGAAGAHGLEDALARRDRVEAWETAVLYHLMHGVALFAASLASGGERRFFLAKCLWISGTLLFSGSLYALSLADWSLLGPLTPIGGALLIGGWIAAPFGWRQKERDNAVE